MWKCGWKRRGRLMWPTIYESIFSLSNISFTKEQIFTDASWRNNCKFHSKTVRFVFHLVLSFSCLSFSTEDQIVFWRRWELGEGGASVRRILHGRRKLPLTCRLVFGGCKRICLSVMRLSHIVLHRGGVHSKMRRSPNIVKVEQCSFGGE